ncbi:MAG: class I SAM-dependent methyltransferase [Clostridiales bacterium]|nr:class I SAM-dependent methyltransferase [Clostridiales bacterium]
MYQEFARVYDEFMETVPYETWADHIESLWQKHDVRPTLVLDLACGTGGLAIELSRRGYDMIGADLSIEMLEEAQEKSAVEGENILWIHQDMRELELFGTVDAIVCTCDSLNYITDLEDLNRVFQGVSAYLESGGTFIFDINTLYKYEQVLAENTYADTYDDAAFIWQNYYDPETRENEYQVTFFVEQEQDQYVRFEEVHIQKAYSLEEIRACFEEAGFEEEGLYDELSLQAPGPDAERVHFVIRKK